MIGRLKNLLKKLGRRKGKGTYLLWKGPPKEETPRYPPEFEEADSSLKEARERLENMNRQLDEARASLRTLRLQPVRRRDCRPRQVARGKRSIKTSAGS